MENIAKALVIATQFIAGRDSLADVDRDVKQLEYIALLLSGASAAELRALVAASNDLGLPDWPVQMGLASEVTRDA